MEKEKPKGEIKKGGDGRTYMVFASNAECEEAAPDGVTFVCFGGYDNAYELPNQ
jgi:hypothetical protein